MKIIPQFLHSGSLLIRQIPHFRCRCEPTVFGISGKDACFLDLGGSPSLVIRPAHTKPLKDRIKSALGCSLTLQDLRVGPTPRSIPVTKCLQPILRFSIDASYENPSDSMVFIVRSGFFRHGYSYEWADTGSAIFSRDRSGRLIV